MRNIPMVSAKMLKNDVFDILKQWKFRFELRRAGLYVARNSLLLIPDASRIKFGENCWVRSFTIIDIVDDPSAPEREGGLNLGHATYIGEHCNIRASGCKINIGNDTMIANSVVMISTNHMMRRGTPMRLQPWDYDRVGISIGNDCWIGSHSTILPGSVIGDGVVIAAGAVVRGNIPPYTIWAGIPAKFVRTRNL